MNVIFFVLLIGPLIFFHELGHYLAAKAFGVGVVSFSVGFGPRLFGFTRGGTEWLIGALPLGGYVRMVGMDPAEMPELTDEERGKALWSKPIWQRSIIVLAGPLANLLIPLPIFMAFYMAQDSRPPAEVGTVMAGMPADDAGLEPGDIIMSVDGDEVRYFDELQGAVGGADGGEIELRILRGEDEFTTTLRPEVTRSKDRWVGLRWVDRYIIGISARTMGTTVLVFDPGGAAAEAGIQTFDRIVRIGGQPVADYPALARRLEANQGDLEIVLLRPEPLGDWLGDFFVEEPVTVTLPAGSATDLGIRSAMTVVYSVQAGSPAGQAGIQRGDEVLRLDGEPINLFSTALSRLGSDPGEHELTVLRQGQEITVQIEPKELALTGDLNQSVRQVVVGMRGLETAHFYPHAAGQPEPLPMSFMERLGYGTRMGFEALFGFILAIVIGVWQLVTGQVGLENLGGPIMIFDLAGRAGDAGPQAFLHMMALISINLGILNLLPIPVLDGGNLMLFGIEAVKRGPISMRTRQIANYVGLVFIIFLFMLVFKNDIERYWSSFAEFFN